MKVKNVMNSRELQFCNPETNLCKAASMMRESNCGALPVVDDENRVIGIVTDRDICLSLAERQPNSNISVKVGDVMSSNVNTVQSEADLQVAFMEMRINRIGRLPVVDKNGRLMGMISLHRLLHKLLEKGNFDLGELTAPNENLLRTIRSVTNRYNGDVTMVKLFPVKKMNRTMAY